MPPPLLVPILLAVALGLAFASLSRRGRARWTTPWLALTAAGALAALAPGFPPALVVAMWVGSLFPFLMLDAALRYCGRPVPRALLPAGIVVGAAKALLLASGYSLATNVLALLVEPWLLLASAVLVQRDVARRRASVPHWFIAPGLLAVACVEIYGPWLGLVERVAPSIPWLAWIVVSVPVAAVQFLSSLDDVRGESARARAALEASEKRATRLAESSGAIIVDIGADGVLRYVSPNHETILGWPADELLGRHLSDVVSELESTAVERLPAPPFRLSDISGNDLRWTHRLRTRSGEHVWFETDVTLYREDGESGPASALLVSRDVTARIEADHAIREREATLRNAQRVAHLGSYDWVVKDDELTWSEEHYRIFGFDPAEPVTNRMFFGAVHDDDRGRLTQAVRRALQDGTPADLEFRIRRPDGEERILHGRGEVEFDADGKPVRLIGTSHDVTERRRVEQAQHVSEERLQALLASLDSNRVVVIDRDGRIRSIIGDRPERAAERFGRERADVPGRHVSEFLPPQAAEEVLRRIRDVFDSGESRETRNEVELPNGVFRFDTTLRPLRTPDGDVEAVLAVVRDETERRAAEEARRESEERLRAILSSLDDTRVVLFDLEGRVVSIFGGDSGDSVEEAARERARGRRLEEFLEPEAAMRAKRMFERVIGTGQLERHRFTLPFGARDVTFDTRISPVRNASGAVQYVLAVARDVTREERAALEHQRLTDQMQQAQKLESLGVLAGGIAHDFNNLLVGIRGNAELALADLAADSPRRSQIEGIGEAAERASDLTEQLLAYAGKAKATVGTVDLSELVGGMARLLRTAVPTTAELRFEVADGEPWIHADAAQVRQVVMNAAANAGEAVGGRAGLVSIETGVMRAGRDYLAGCTLAEELDPGPCAYVEVRDDGCGIDSETLTRIFDPFFTTKFQGRGLGLAAVLGIVRSHGGAIRVESELGRGTSFRVLLPLVGSPHETTKEPPVEKPWRGRGTVIVVDDEPIVQSVAKGMLEAQGFDVVVAASGAEAIEALGRPHMGIVAVLLDLSMPGMDGEATFHAIRSAQPNLPVIFMSGHGSAEIAGRLVGQARVRRLRKPFRMSDLIDSLRDALAEPGRSDPTV